MRRGRVRVLQSISMKRHHLQSSPIEAEFARRDGRELYLPGPASATVEEGAAPGTAPGGDGAGPAPPGGLRIQFAVSGEPKPQPRPRAFARKLAGGGYAARVFDAGTAEAWKSLVAQAAKPWLPATPCQEALRLSLVFEFARPKAHFTTRGVLRANAPCHPMGKGDVDNLAKAVLDALTQIGLWRDDGQVVKLEVVKRYAARSGALVEMAAEEGRGRRGWQA